ncbi:MAG: autoinducer 2 ABC transporter substrate-binding protein [Planctomycetaceae bacterium]|mgnify:CR=1 FL=1|jgi:rhamnose transport system substrate-binding protein|nr:autoinducer 2 ABC transporter substrate-binding protein [Planctomycetaceae bacterium]|tara:strand:- start:15319 stop:16353 length:1035 start_codon:yes stop_codon:yes gene_type:complete
MKYTTIIYLLLLTLVIGCGSENDTTSTETGTAAENTETLRIGVMPKLVGITYFEATGQGAKQAGEELDINVHYDGPTSAIHEDQVRMLNTWMAQDFDVLAIAPNDPDAISSTLRSAVRDGFTVMTWDTDANADTSRRQVFVNQASNQSIADTMVDIMVQGLEEQGKEPKGKFLIVSGTPTASNQNTWIRFMKARIESEFPDMEILETLMPGEDQSKAQEMTTAALNSHNDIVGIWGLTSVAIPAAAKAIEDAGKTSEIYATGIGLPSSMKPFVESGSCTKFALWDPVDLGYLSVYVAHHLKTKGELADGTYDFGRIKGVVVKDGEAILGPPIVFTKENIANYNF